jgi:hypothetical protein
LSLVLISNTSTAQTEVEQGSAENQLHLCALEHSRSAPALLNSTLIMPPSHDGGGCAASRSIAVLCYPVYATCPPAYVIALYSEIHVMRMQACGGTFRCEPCLLQAGHAPSSANTNRQEQLRVSSGLPLGRGLSCKNSELASQDRMAPRPGRASKSHEYQNQAGLHIDCCA